MIATLFMGFQSSLKAQKVTPPDNKGQWVVFLDNKYHPTKEDILEIAKGMPYMKEDTFYRLKSKKNFYVYSPDKWVELMKEILTKVKGSPVTNVYKELLEGEIVPGDDNVSTTTKNYGVTKNGKSFVVDAEFKGDDSTEFFVYKGYRVLKIYKACMNPQDPNMTKKSTPVPDPKVEEKKEDTPKVDTKKVEAEEYIPDPTPWVASSKPEAKKMEMGDEVEDKGTWTHIPKRNYHEPERPRIRLSIGINFGPRQPYYGGQTFNPIPGDRHDPPVLGGGNGRHDPQLLFF